MSFGGTRPRRLPQLGEKEELRSSLDFDIQSRRGSEPLSREKRFILYILC